MAIFGAAIIRRTCLALAIRTFPSSRRDVSSRAAGSQYKFSSSQSSATAFSASAFTPPEPPSSKGMAVYSDIKLVEKIDPSSDAFQRNNDENSVYVVTGASRGIGLQFVKALLLRTTGTVVACCRSPNTATRLNDFIASQGKDKSRIRVVELDMEDQQSIDHAAAKVKDSYGRVDLLLNVAGILGDAATTPGPERTINKLEREWIEKSLAVNVIGPMMLCKELAPLMKTKRVQARPTSVVASLSARVGSISDNELGGWYSYRFSKAALNQGMRSLSHELKRQGTWTISLHPGTTDTDLSKPFQRNVQEGRLFPVDFTVEQLMKVIESMNETNSGGLYDWAGKAIPF